MTFNLTEQGRVHFCIISSFVNFFNLTEQGRVHFIIDDKRSSVLVAVFIERSAVATSFFCGASFDRDFRKLFSPFLSVGFWDIAGLTILFLADDEGGSWLNDVDDESVSKSNDDDCFA